MKPIIIVFSLMLFFSLASSVFAVGAGTDNTCPPDAVCLDNPLALSGIDTPQKLIGKVIDTIFGIVGSISLLVIIYSGIMFLISAGNAERVQTAKKVLVYAVIGMVIIFSAYALTKFIIVGVGG